MAKKSGPAKSKAKAKAKVKATTRPAAKAKPKAKAEAGAKAKGGGAGTRPKGKAPARGAPAGGLVRVRMYRHGLGDCFLLTFPRKGPHPDGAGRPYHVLIDCGIIPGTPDGTERMRQVVADIKQATGGKIDVLVATHEHADHISGFDQAADLFESIEVEQVWLAWTEDPDDKVARALRAERRRKLAALWLGFHHLRGRMESLGASPAEREDVERAAEVLSFFGIDPNEPADFPPDSGGFGAAARALEAEGATARAMRWAGTKGKAAPRYCAPGEVMAPEGVEGLRVFVLGPPRDLAQLHKDLPSSSKGKPKETYEDEGEAKVRPAGKGLALAMAGAGAVERAFFAAAFGARDEAATSAELRIESDKAVPFDRKYQIDWEKAQDLEFFRDRYFGEERAQADRRIDGEWAAGAAAFAMKLDGDTNNTSLALAFELPGGPVLLFPGDAQVGNWESWHVDSEGAPRVYVDESTGRRVSAEALLNRVVLYKVGHHGSHNATLRDLGLEMMTRPDLSAMVPVDAYVAHVKKRWGKMPFHPLIERLAEKAGDGRVIRADTPLKGAPTKIQGDGLAVTIADAAATFDGDFDVEGQDDKVKRPLYVEFLIDAK